MSIQSVLFVLDRLFKDPRLFHQYMDDPYGTLTQFELTPQEVEAVVSGNRERLIAIGVDERVAGWILRPSTGAAST